MGRKKPCVKKYSTNVDTISLNIEQFINEDPRFPYHSEPPPSDIRRLYKKGHQFCSPSVPAENLRLFLDGLKREYKRHPGEMGCGQVIWEGGATSAMGSSNKEVYSLDCKNITNYVYDAETYSCIFKREMKLGKKVFEELLKDLNGKSGFSDYMVLLSLFESQRHYDSENASQAGYSPKVKVVFGQPETYSPKKWKRNY